MQTLPEDILNTYPIFATGFRSISKEMDILTLKTVCKQYVNKQEISLYLEKESYRRLGLFYLNETEQMYVYVHPNDPLLYSDHNFNIVMNGSAYIDEETGNLEFRIPHFGMVDKNVMKESLYDYTHFVDVKNAFKIFSQRKQCLTKKDYAKDKTLNYFNYIISLFNKPGKLHLLHLYLITNGLLLKMDDAFIISELVNISVDDEVYYNETIEYAKDLIVAIKDLISKFTI